MRTRFFSFYVFFGLDRFFLGPQKLIQSLFLPQMMTKMHFDQGEPFVCVQITQSWMYSLHVFGCRWYFLGRILKSCYELLQPAPNFIAARRLFGCVRIGRRYLDPGIGKASGEKNKFPRECFSAVHFFSASFQTRRDHLQVKPVRPRHEVIIYLSDRPAIFIGMFQKRGFVVSVERVVPLRANFFQSGESLGYVLHVSFHGVGICGLSMEWYVRNRSPGQTPA
jgi:hypothetical protein